jgi:hypothetical protein
LIAKKKTREARVAAEMAVTLIAVTMMREGSPSIIVLMKTPLM